MRIVSMERFYLMIIHPMEQSTNMFCACFTIHHELLISKQTVKNVCQIAFLMSLCEKQNKTKHRETKNKKQTKKSPSKAQRKTPNKPKHYCYVYYTCYRKFTIRNILMKKVGNLPNCFCLVEKKNLFIYRWKRHVSVLQTYF